MDEKLQVRSAPESESAAAVPDEHRDDGVIEPRRVRESGVIRRPQVALEPYKGRRHGYRRSRAAVAGR